MSDPTISKPDDSDIEVWNLTVQGSITLPDGVTNSGNLPLNMTKTVYMDLADFTVTKGETTAYISNNTGKTQTATIVIADYDPKGNVIGIQFYKNVEFDANESKLYKY